MVALGSAPRRSSCDTTDSVNPEMPTANSEVEASL
jgi:hypothetical protein